MQQPDQPKECSNPQRVIANASAVDASPLAADGEGRFGGEDGIQMGRNYQRGLAACSFQAGVDVSGGVHAHITQPLCLEAFQHEVGARPLLKGGRRDLLNLYSQVKNAFECVHAGFTRSAREARRACARPGMESSR